MQKLKKKIGLISVVLICFIFSCSVTQKKEKTSLKFFQPEILKTDGNEWFQRWTISNEEYLWEKSDADNNSLGEFHDLLQIKLGNQELANLILKESLQDHKLDTTEITDGDLFNHRLVHSGLAGKIRPINFIEADLLNYQMNRYPMISHPTEFHGLILLHEIKDSVRIYFAGSDQPWPPKPGVIMDSLKVDLNGGWEFLFHLHNHYEPKEKQYVGLLAPSLADVQFYTFLRNEYKLRKALITNGFHTLELNTDEISGFKSH
jgi:hypothetical protein